MGKGRLLPLAAALSALTSVVWASAPASPPVQPTEAGVFDPTRLDPLFAPGEGTRAVLVLQDGRVVAKRYAPGFSDANRFVSWSMAKTLTAMLVGELVADGRLRLDAPAPIAEWRDSGDPRGRITLRQLLQMSSGLRHIEVGEPVQNSDTNQVLFVSGTGHMAADAIARPLAHPPGTVFNYDTLTTVILAEIVTRALTPSPNPRVRAAAYRAFAKERLFGPAGIRSAKLEFDGAGTQVGGSLIYMTLGDWGRFGHVLLDGTGERGERVVAPDWLAFLKTPSLRNAQYGGQTWLNRRGEGEPVLFPDKGLPTVAASVGHLGQYVLADQGPDGRSLVVVRLGKTADGTRPGVMDRIGDLFVGWAKETAE